jgi:hypothetical protein
MSVSVRAHNLRPRAAVIAVHSTYIILQIIVLG